MEWFVDLGLKVLPVIGVGFVSVLLIFLAILVVKKVNLKRRKRTGQRRVNEIKNRGLDYNADEDEFFTIGGFLNFKQLCEMSESKWQGYLNQAVSLKEKLDSKYGTYFYGPHLPGFRRP